MVTTTTPAPPPLYSRFVLTKGRPVPQERLHIETRTRLALAHVSSVVSKDPKMYTGLYTDMAEMTLSEPDAFGRTTIERAPASVDTTNNAVGSTLLEPFDGIDATLTKLEAIIRAAMWM